MQQNAYIGVCWAVAVTELNNSYSEANAQTCIKITKLVSIFIGSSLMARSQEVRHQLLQVERNLIQAFLYYLIESPGLGKDIFAYRYVIPVSAMKSFQCLPCR